MKKLIILALMALPLGAMAQKFAHIDATAVFTAMPETVAAQTELQTLQTQLQEEFQRMQDELRTKYEDYQKNEATFPEPTKQRRQQELQDLNQRMEEFAQKSEQDMQTKYQEKVAPIHEKLLKAIEEVGNAGGYVYVMDVSAQATPILFFNQTLSTDITDQVKTKLGIK
ncbi:MAG: OmpH family outer membrane protein [Bacteroidaceae bacterium]|nr:OmpH family outer membrane protein [Bacteroidaceae bacterium]MBQ9175946.1 OmpH family outer membrane protein [Bacteroidaceae bacterium]MBR1378082.1 OmpH family outer membrane protein [Bacteroidaceae bacterium]